MDPINIPKPVDHGFKSPFTIPSAMFIESAEDTLRSMASDALAARRKELCEAVPSSDEFVAGYQLGLATAEVMLALRGIRL